MSNESDRETSEREALLDAVAHLAGAASAYRAYAKRHPSKGKAAVDPFFSTRADDFDKAVERGRTALAAPEQGVEVELPVPAGWKLVPITATQEMCQQGQWKAQEWRKFPLRISPIYQAMLDAAPTPPTVVALARREGAE